MNKERVRAIVVVNFDKYNPPSKAINKEVRDGGAMKWVRWEVGAHRDPDILDMPPSQRFLWQTLVELVGTRRIDDRGRRVVHITLSQLARESAMPEKDVAAGLEHLRKRRRIRYVQGGDEVANRHPRTTQKSELGGHVPTYLPTDLQTVATASKEARTTTEGRAAWVQDPALRGLLEARLARHAADA